MGIIWFTARYIESFVGTVTDINGNYMVHSTVQWEFCWHCNGSSVSVTGRKFLGTPNWCLLLYTDSAIFVTCQIRAPHNFKYVRSEWIFVALFCLKIQDLKTSRNCSARTSYSLCMRAFSRENFCVTNACSHSFRLLLHTTLSEK